MWYHAYVTLLPMDNDEKKLLSHMVRTVLCSMDLPRISLKIKHVSEDKSGEHSTELLSIKYDWQYNQAILFVRPRAVDLLRSGGVETVKKAVCHEMAHLYTLPVFHHIGSSGSDVLDSILIKQHELLTEKIAYHLYPLLDISINHKEIQYV